MTDPQDQELNRTPLYSLHRVLGAKVMSFAGYELPLQYESIVAEHLHTRESASLVDVSHMGQAILRGENVAAVFETLIPGDIQGLSAGKTTYTLLTNDRGGYGPTVGGPVAMGYVNLEPAQPGKAVNFLVRGQVLAAKVARLAFVEHRYFRG